MKFTGRRLDRFVNSAHNTQLMEFTATKVNGCPRVVEKKNQGEGIYQQVIAQMELPDPKVLCSAKMGERCNSFFLLCLWAS